MSTDAGADHRGQLTDRQFELLLKEIAAHSDRIKEILDLMANRHLNREHVLDHVDVEPLNLSFAGENWLRVVRDRCRPGQLLRRHLEVCRWWLTTAPRQACRRRLGSSSTRCARS